MELILVIILVALAAGWIVIFQRLGEMTRRIEGISSARRAHDEIIAQVLRQLERLESLLGRGPVTPSGASETPSAEAVRPSPAESSEPPVETEQVQPETVHPAAAPEAFTPTAIPCADATAQLLTTSRQSIREKIAGQNWETVVGGRWLNWVGIVLVTIGVAYFLKYMYDNEWIGPIGRIAIGTMAGIAALVLGEKSRRAGYPILFHALTGGGFAAFYLCIYFSFQVYHLTGQIVSFSLSILVTGFAVEMAVIHNARVICLLAQIGGFLSPILLSTGENRPIALFSFVTVLNLATTGSAYYKNWRDVNTLAFAGTWLLYVGWYDRFYDQTQLGIALFFSSLFYLMFLIIPMARAAVQRQPVTAQNLWLITVNIIVVFVNYYVLLFSDHRAWLGFAVILQAVTLFGSYAYWAHRLGQDSKTRATLLVAALALVTVAIPIQLRFYAVPIGWAMEAFVLGYIGQRYQHRTFQFAALAAILLAAGGLLVKLPLHTKLFTPIFNRPFGSWLTVIAFTFLLSSLLQRHRDQLDASLKRSPFVPLGLGVILLCALIHMEIATFWIVRRELWKAGVAVSHQYTALTFLWSAIPLIFLWLGRNGIVRFSIPGAIVGYGVGLLVILQGALRDVWIVFDLPFLNVQWISRFAFAASLWLGSNWMRSVPDPPRKWEGWTTMVNTVEGVGHVILVFLLQAEVNVWMSESKVFSSLMRYGFTSTLWSLYALGLIAIGLGTRHQFRRITGFALFGVTVAKILVVDMAVLQPVYRILSFVACGALLVVAAYLYQRFAKALLESDPGHPKPEKGGAL